MKNRAYFIIAVLFLVAFVTFLTYGCGGGGGSSGSSGPTAPAQATSPTPANGATNVPITITQITYLSTLGDTKNIYFGTTNPPTTLITSLPTLNYGTTYYWRVDTTNSVGTTTGIVWSFTTALAPVAKAAFVMDTGALKVVPLTGGTPTTLVSSGVSECQITQDNTKVVYLTDIGDLKVILIGGGTSTNLAINVGSFDIAKNSSKVVYIDNYEPTTGTGDLNVISISGGTPTLLDTDVNEYEISDDSNKVVYLCYSVTNDLYVISINGGTPALLMNDVWSFKIAPNSTKVVYTDNYDLDYYDGDLNVISIGGGTPTLLATNVSDFAISANSTKVVYIDYDNDITNTQYLNVISINGVFGSETVLLSGTDIGSAYYYPFEVTQDSAKVVYIDNGSASGWDLNVIAITGGTPTLLDANTGLFLVTNDSAKVVYLDSYNLSTYVGELKVIPIIGGISVSLSTGVTDADITQ